MAELWFVEPRGRVSGLLESEGFSRTGDELLAFWELLWVAFMKRRRGVEASAIKSDYRRYKGT